MPTQVRKFEKRSKLSSDYVPIPRHSSERAKNERCRCRIISATIWRAKLNSGTRANCEVRQEGWVDAINNSLKGTDKFEVSGFTGEESVRNYRGSNDNVKGRTDPSRKTPIYYRGNCASAGATFLHGSTRAHPARNGWVKENWWRSILQNYGSPNLRNWGLASQSSLFSILSYIYYTPSLRNHFNWREISVENLNIGYKTKEARIFSTFSTVILISKIFLEMLRFKNAFSPKCNFLIVKLFQILRVIKCSKIIKII